jgi:hypothetical protein
MVPTKKCKGDEAPPPVRISAQGIGLTENCEAFSHSQILTEGLESKDFFITHEIIPARRRASRGLYLFSSRNC